MDPTEQNNTPAPKKQSFFKSPSHLLLLLVVLVALIVAAVLIGSHKKTGETTLVSKTPPSANSPSLYLSPTKQTVKTGDSVTVSVWEDSGSQGVNAVQASLTYPVSAFEVTNIDASSSAFDVQAQSTGSDGKIMIARGHIGELVGKQLVAKVTLKALTDTKEAKIDFVDGSQLASAKTNKDILSVKTGGTYTIGVK